MVAFKGDDKILMREHLPLEMRRDDFGVVYCSVLYQVTVSRVRYLVDVLSENYRENASIFLCYASTYTIVLSIVSFGLLYLLEKKLIEISDFTVTFFPFWLTIVWTLLFLLYLIEISMYDSIEHNTSHLYSIKYIAFNSISTNGNTVYATKL